MKQTVPGEPVGYSGLYGFTANWITRYGARARGSMLFHWLMKSRSSSSVEPGEM